MTDEGGRERPGVGEVQGGLRVHHILAAVVRRGVCCCDVEIGNAGANWSRTEAVVSVEAQV